MVCLPQSKLRLLDLFCGAGGCTKGYQRAGFYVVGVDVATQPNYCGDEFYKADALSVLDGTALLNIDLRSFDAIHASPPCQSYSRAMKHLAKAKPMLIDGVQEYLRDSGVPWVVENVEGAPLPDQPDLFGRHGLMLCGSSFGLRVFRHRLFETSFPIVGPPCSHKGHAMNPHNGAGRARIYEEFGRRDPEGPWRDAMGVDWMNRQEARESVPPAFTEFIGTKLHEVCRQRVVGHDAQGAATAGGSGVPENDGDESVGIFPLDALGPDEGGLRITELAGRVGHNTVHTDAVGERESGHGPHHALPAPDVKEAA